MDTNAQQSVITGSGRTEAISRSKSRPWQVLALSAILLVAAGLRLVNLDSLGFANHYYAAAVKSMLFSWHNFFFVAAEPGGSVSVDKPPVGLWLQALSARIFGVNTFGLILPQIIAGLLSIVLVYHLVRRKFGAPAGLLAAFVLAITPVMVATDRNNTMDSTLIFTLLLAAWAFIKATETARLRYLLAGAVLVGIAFNIKMLEAYLPLPAFLALYFLGAQERLLPKLGKLILTMLVLVVISLSWAVAVDLTPADQRPYVGSSGDNSELSLIIGYNGIERLVGLFGGPGGRSGSNQESPGISPPSPGSPPGRNIPPSSPGMPPGGFSPTGPGNPPGGNRGIGFSGTGQAGPLRLFIPPLSKEASWLLPLALCSIILLLVTARFSWPVGHQHQAVVLWGGWLLTAGVFFSIANFFHEYYLSTLAPPLAALVAIGLVRTWQVGKQKPWLLALLLVIVTTFTLLLQYNTARSFISSISWLPLVIGLFLVGAGALLAASLLHPPISRVLLIVGMAGLLAAMLVTPTIWAVLTARYPTENQSLPAAYDGTNKIPASSGQLQVDSELLAFLQANTQGVEYLMAVPSSMQGADYVLATGRPVLYMGGFMGQDEVLSPASLAKLVAEGKLRYIYWNTAGEGRPGDGAFGGQSLITSWVSTNCQAVRGYNTTTRNFGAPDGISGGTISPGFPGGAQAVALYDCGK